MKPSLSPLKVTALALFIATTSVSSIALADTATKLNAQAKQYYANKEYSQAFNTYQQAANQGNAKSMAWVGYFYANGKGVPKDVPKAIEWYTKAADGGDSWAMDRLGDIYRKGIGVNKNEVVAAGWYQKAAAKGQADSMSWMYTFYRDGRGGLPKDEVKAIEWLKKAAEAGDDWAMRILGKRYRKGEGVAQDYIKAMEWYQKAAEKGNSRAMFNVGFMYRQGQGVDQNYNESFKWLKKAAEKGNTTAMADLSAIYVGGFPQYTNVSIDYEKGYKWAERSAKKGNSMAMQNLGVIYRDALGVPQDYKQAMDWFKKAAEKNNAQAMTNIGSLYSEGLGIKKDDQQAMRWFKKAAELGEPTAMSNIGVHYYNGEGVVKDYAKALEWYKKSIEAGSQEAKVRATLGRMYQEGEGTEKDYMKALSWYEKAAEKGSDVALNDIGRMYKDGIGVSVNYAKAMRAFKKAANQGNSASMFNIGLMYSKGLGVTKNLTESFNWYKKAADRGMPNAMRNVAVAYQNGEGVAKNQSKSLEWFKKAADKGEKQSLAIIASNEFKKESFSIIINEDGSFSTIKDKKDNNKIAEMLVESYQLHLKESYDKTDSKNRDSIKKILENLLATNKITDPTIRKQVEAIFTKPPLITWQTTPPNTINNDTLNLSVLLTDQGGGIGDVRVLLDGVAIDQSSRGLSRQVNQTTRDFTLSIPKGSHTITVEAYPGDNIGVTSKVVKQITSTYAPMQKPKLHAVVIGIDTYQNPDLKLNYASKDASAIYNTLNKQVGSIYDKGYISLLNTAGSTSKANIISKVNEIKANADMGDVFVFYAASHGYNFPDTGYHLFTSDVGATSSNKVAQTGINAEDLQDLLAQVNTDKKLILLDTCDSGGSIDAGQLIVSRGLDDQMVIERMQRKAGATVIMASSDKQKALEGYQGHGVFTYGLLQAFDGAGDTNKDGYMKTNELSSYIEDKIPTIAKKAFNQPQYPTASTVGNGFEFKVF